MIYYAIRHKPTGFYLPATQKRRGFTHDEPMDPKVIPPRLFPKKRSASSALDWWLDGLTSVFHDGEGGEDWKTEKVESRRPEDMEVIKLHLYDDNNYPSQGD